MDLNTAAFARTQRPCSVLLFEPILRPAASTLKLLPCRHHLHPGSPRLRQLLPLINFFWDCAPPTTSAIRSPA